MFDSDSECPNKSAAKILGIDGTATQKDAADSYRRLARKYHPDRVLHLSDDQKTIARQKMAEINQAYDYLKPLLPTTTESVSSDTVDKPSKKAPRKPRKKPSNQQTKSTTKSEKTDAAVEDEVEVEVDRLIEFACPTCKSRIRVAESLRGKQGKCTRCRQLITVPTHIDVRCIRCRKINRIPGVLNQQRAICRKCYGSLDDAQRL